MIYEIMNILQIEKEADILSTLRNLVNLDKMDTRFVRSMSDLTLKCAPAGYFKEIPTQ